MKRRNTETQTAILELLRRDQRAYSHEMLKDKLKIPVDRVTVYRILNRFVEDGLAHRIVADDGRQYFAGCEESCENDRHSHDHLHFRCVVCEQVECLSEQVEFSLPKGYRVDNFNITVSGKCRGCE